jgi:acyl-CoA thioester hydrolase
MTDNLNLSESVEIKIPFHDVDVMEVVWHGHYTKYFEIARCKLLDRISYNYPQMRDSGYMWPVIDLRIRYVKSARFQQLIKVTAKIVEWENRLRIQYLIEDAKNGQRLSKGHTDMVAVNIKTGEMLLASPDILLCKLGVQGE